MMTLLRLPRTALLGAFALSGLLPLAAAEPTPELLWQQPSTSLPEWMRNQTIYEINVRQYSEAGTFAAVEADLDRLESLGVGTLWLMPIHPIGKVNRKGTLGSYYSISDYQAVNPEFGTKDDFRSLVRAAHARGMRVILDWVGNHTAWDHPYTESHPEFFMTDHTGSFIPPLGFDWTDVIQIDYNHPGVLDFHLDAMRYWVEEFGIDGYRCDYATGIPTEFWDRLMAALLETRGDLFLLAEAEVPSHQLNAFHASYGWAMMHAFNAIAQGKESASHLDDVLAQTGLQFPAGSDFLYLTSNHDENTWLGTVFERLGGGVEPFAVLSFALDGIPMIYNGQEAGLDKRIEFFERDPIEWREHRLFAFYQTLVALKTEHPALRTGAPFARVPTTMNSSIYALLRGEAGGPQVLVVANLTAGNHEFGLGAEGLAGNWRDVFSGETVVLGDSWHLELPSWRYRVLARLP
jgi:cyclomaltodextrinase / maltogenic alpha-amylase / neopullulanase